MPPRKSPGKKGLLPKLKSFLDALGDRYQWALTVIDEALASDNLKDKIWAVDLILKRAPAPPDTNANHADTAATRTQEADPQALAQLSEAELLKRIRAYLHEDAP